VTIFTISLYFPKSKVNYFYIPPTNILLLSSQLTYKAAISVDYRINDGAEGASAPEKHRDDVAGFLENPVRMLV
jgi:hypothetical protein